MYTWSFPSEWLSGTSESWTLQTQCVPGGFTCGHVCMCQVHVLFMCAHTYDVRMYLAINLVYRGHTHCMYLAVNLVYRGHTHCMYLGVNLVYRGHTHCVYLAVNLAYRGHTHCVYLGVNLVYRGHTHCMYLGVNLVYRGHTHFVLSLLLCALVGFEPVQHQRECHNLQSAGLCQDASQ